MLRPSFSNLTAKVCGAIALSSLTMLSAPVAQANPNLTDADQFPHLDYPPTYLEVINKVLDFTSDSNLHAPLFDATFRDLLVARQNNAYRTVIKEMWDRQTAGSPRIRTRDIASPFTTQLSCFSSYYYSSGIEVPTNFSADCPATVEFAEVVKEPEAPTEPVYTSPAPSRPLPPVRALW